MKSTTLYKTKTPYLSTKDRRLITHAWFYSVAFLLAAFAMGQGRFVLFMIMIGTFVHSLLISLILQRYPSPLQKHELVWRIKRSVRYTREDFAYFFAAQTNRKGLLLHRLWGMVFFLETSMLNAVIAHRRKIKDFRGPMRYHRLQVKLEKLRKAIYQQCSRWYEFDEAAKQHAREEYEYE